MGLPTLKVAPLPELASVAVMGKTLVKQLSIVPQSLDVA
jgi:hypothetical protein